MRQVVKDFVSIAVGSLVLEEPIYEFGSLQVAGQEHFADLRSLFAGGSYVGVDMREGPGVDRVLNLHDIDLPAASVGTVLCLDTLEHVEYPHRALEEIYRILKPNGTAVISSVMNFHIHNFPNDYWRFTPQAFKSLLKSFAGSFVGFAGRERFPHTVVGIGFKGTVPEITALNAPYADWQERHLDPPVNMSPKEIAKLLMPPLFARIPSCVRKTVHRVTKCSTQRPMVLTPPCELKESRPLPAHDERHR